MSEQNNPTAKIGRDKHETNQFLTGQQIIPTLLGKDTTITELVEQTFNAYNAGRLGEACRLYANQILAPAQDTTVCLTMAGALTPAGLGGSVISLMEAGFIDFIISTGANMYHDIHHALDMKLHRGDFRLDDIVLHEQGVIRIYDILFSEQVLLDTDAFIRGVLAASKVGAVSTAELHHMLGTVLLEHAPYPERSILAQAARLNIPIYTSSPGDSSIGMNVARLALDGSSFALDPAKDVNETTALVWAAKKNGVIILGGGSPKNFYLQTQPQLWEVLGIQKGGHDYFIQMTMDMPHWGGLSGATPSEAVSWGKIKPEELNQTVVVYADTTISFPLLAAYALAKAVPRPLKQLYKHRERLLAELTQEYKQGASKEE